MTPSQYGILIAAVTLLVVPGSWCLALHRRVACLLLIAGGMGLMCVGLVLRERPDLLVPFGTSRVLLWTHGCLLPWGALVMLGACIPWLKHRAKICTVACFTLVAAGVLSWYPMKLALRAYQDLGRTPAARLCRQSTGWSCGPAAAATLLTRMGVPVDEAEMARRCGTIPGRGTSDYGLWRGLRTSLDPGEFEVDLVRTDDRSFDRLTLPALVRISYFFGCDHSLVLLRIDRGDPIIADPAYPETYRLTREYFVSIWRGSAVVVRKM